MRGTQLTALHDDYDEIGEKLTTTDTIIDRKRRAIPDLRKRADETKLRYHEALERDKLEDQLEVLSNELAWVQVILKEKEAALSQKNRDAAERQVNQAKEKLAAVQVSYIGSPIEKKCTFVEKKKRKERILILFYIYNITFYRAKLTILIKGLKRQKDKVMNIRLVSVLMWKGNERKID